MYMKFKLHEDIIVASRIDMILFEMFLSKCFCSRDEVRVHSEVMEINI